MSPVPEPSTVVLRALEGAPLAEVGLRDIVVATAHAIAERNGVEMIRLETGPDQIVATLGTNRLAAIGFAAELRRLTTAWYKQKFGVDSLWGDPRARGEPEDPYGLFDGMSPIE